MRKASVKPVLLARDQIEALQRIQDEERRNSPLGIAPSIHEVPAFNAAGALSRRTSGLMVVIFW
ncbi:hypothetical protein KX458_26050 [Escherichia coli]|nr:hypothetical protein [Escherichia coli]